MIVKIEETIRLGNYKLDIECNNIAFSDIEFSLFDLDCHEKFPVLVFTLSPLWELEPFNEQMKLYKLDEKEKIIVKQIERLFVKGDYYQSALERSSEVVGKRISYTSVAHQLIINNKNKLKFIKRIFSSSLNRYKWEHFFTDEAVSFWSIQLTKGQPFGFFKKDRRYFIQMS